MQLMQLTDHARNGRQVHDREVKARAKVFTLFLLFFLLSVLALSVAFPQIAHAVIPIYVRTDGNDVECDGLVDAAYPGGSGPLPCAKQTIQVGIDTAGSGGFVRVAAGTYVENLSLNYAIDVEGAGADITIIDGGGADRVITQNSADMIQFYDLTIQNGFGDSGGGGGVRGVVGGTINLSDCIVRDNVASDGAGIYALGSLNISRCTILGNTASSSQGGGLAVFGDTTLSDVSIRDNHAPASAGGGILIIASVGKQVLLQRVTVRDNTAGVNGAGIKIQGDGSNYLANVTIYNNTSSALGAGVLISGTGGATTIENSTISGNTSTGGNTGGIAAYQAVIFANTIVAGNSGFQCADGTGGSWYSNGYNIDSGTTCAFTNTGDLSNTDPKLGPLQDHGGYVKTLPLLYGSPAIGAGDGTTCQREGFADGVDARLVDRPQGVGCDIGAYERVFDTPADFDGDAFSDVVVFRAGAWRFFDAVSGTFDHGVWTGSSPGCIPAPLDYDGDGEDEPSQLCSGSWHFYNDDGTYNKGIWTGGVAGDLPVPADYDGDGVDDVVVWRAGAWRFFDFTSGTFDHGVWTGSPPHWLGGTNIPAPMDYDGDGDADFTVFSGGPWHFYNHDGSYAKGIWTGGVAGDLPVPADYADEDYEQVVVWRAGAWRVFDYETGGFVGGVWTGAPPHWTGGTPLPAPLDVNGDGSADLTVFSGGPWHFYNTDGSYAKGIWTGGVVGDLPISRRQLP